LKTHILQLLQKSKRKLGFIFRNSKNFKNIQTLLILYYALVRSNLQFGALIWNPNTLAISKALEQIQKRFLKYLYWKTFDYYPNAMKYEELLSGFEIKSLENERRIVSLMFLYDVLKGGLDPELLCRINICVPRLHSRHKILFRVQYRTNILKNSVLNNAMGLYNRVLTEHSHFDIFNLDRVQFKKLLSDIYA